MAAVDDDQTPTSAPSLDDGAAPPSDAPTPSGLGLAETPAGVTRLDILPPEILLEVTAQLDWRSLFCLERVSPHCRDAVRLHLGRLRSLSVSRSDLADVAPSCRKLSALLTRLPALREINVSNVGGWLTSREMLQALLAGSRCWPRLERLALHRASALLDQVLLERLCGNCERLKEVALSSGDDDRAVQAVLAARPGLTALSVTGVFRSRPGCGFMSQLPPGLRQLTLYCGRLHSAAVAELARCGELRRLELWSAWGLRPDHLAAGLAGCHRLEDLTISFLDSSVSDCLPPAGLPTLTSLSLADCDLTDADLARLMSLLPGLRSVRLWCCYGLTPQGLAQLSRLPQLSSLNLAGTGGMSDWTLSRLSSSPLVELRLGIRDGLSPVPVTAEGLFRLSQSCPTLRSIIVRAFGKRVWRERVECGPGVDEGRLRASLAEVVDLSVLRGRATGGR